MDKFTRQEQIKKVEKIGFVAHLGIKVEQDDENQVVCSMTLAEKHKNPLGVCHGGVIFSLADTAFGILTNREKLNLTRTSSMDFLRKTVGQKLVAKATRTGERSGAVEVFCDETLVACATFSG